jgi:hypothetical protein
MADCCGRLRAVAPEAAPRALAPQPAPVLAPPAEPALEPPVTVAALPLPASPPPLYVRDGLYTLHAALLI